MSRGALKALQSARTESSRVAQSKSALYKENILLATVYDYSGYLVIVNVSCNETADELAKQAVASE